MRGRWTVLPLPLVDTAVRRAERKAEEQQQHHGANGRCQTSIKFEGTQGVSNRDGRVSFISL